MAKFFQLSRASIFNIAMLFGGVLFPLVLFGGLGSEVMEGEGFFFDHPLLLFAHSQSSPALDQAMLIFSFAGSLVCIAPFELIIFGLLLYKRRRPDAVFSFIALVGAAVLNLFAKSFFSRDRPDLWLSLQPEVTFSFPSGHAMNSMALAATVTILSRKSRFRWPVVAIAVPFVLLVSVSRVYLGVHYPSDILAGWVAALAWVIGITLISEVRMDFIKKRG